MDITTDTTNQTQRAIDKAREIMESFDQTGAMTIGYEGTYTLTAEQMTTIAGALYLADCELHDLKQKK
jgi:hypothetical protein